MTLGVITAGSEQSVAAGAHAFRAGGNAVDAAVAATFATAAGDPSITSLAGGGVLIFRAAESRELEVCDFFATAPGLGGRRHGAGPNGGGLPRLDFRAVELDFGIGGTRQLFHIGRGAAAVPGVIPGLVAALERWGRLDLEQVLQPTVRFLSEGVQLNGYQTGCFRVLEPILRESEYGRRIFLGADGNLLPPGARFRDPLLARTLRSLAEEGLETAYQEKLAETMLRDFGEERGGWLTREDIDSWEAEFRPALVAQYRGATVATNPAPAVGGRFVLLTLGLMQRARVTDEPESSTERYRRLAAVFRAVSEARAEFPGLVEGTDAEAILARRLDSILGGEEPPNGRGEPRSAGNTTHVSAIDREGNAAGVTVSHGEGCGYWITDSGLHMNNMLGEEDLFPGGFHRFTPGRRLKTMMAPTIIVEPSGALAVLGSGGSNRIRTAMAQTISALVDDRVLPESAVTRGRIHVEGGVLSAETYALPGNEAALQEARKLARETKIFDGTSLFFGGVHLAHRDADGRLSGSGDPRRGGVSLVVEGL